MSLRGFERVVAFLGEQNPNVLALYEVEGKTVFEDLVTRAFVLGGGRLREREGPQSGPKEKSIWREDRAPAA